MTSAHSQPLNQVEIEAEILRFSEMLEHATESLAEYSVAASEAEVAYRVKYAKHFVKAEGSMDLRTQLSVVACADELGLRRHNEAMRDSLTEKCRMLRAQLDAVRTLAANVRSSGG